MRAARPVQEWLADPRTGSDLKLKLELARKIRAFAVSDLGLPDNTSYQSYADIGRSAVVWNVVAAPELSLELQTWCFPIAGCVGYRGYFSEDRARSEASRLKQQGLDVGVLPVPAYSTLGWLNWLGGDSLLSSFILYQEDDLARLLFHELAHQVIYMRDDTSFNESFASAVEQIGVQRWRASRGLVAEPAQAMQRRARRAEFAALVEQTRLQLRRVYAEHQSGRSSAERARQDKSEVMSNFRARYRDMRRSWASATTGLAAEAAQATGLAAYDRWVENANNASFAARASYEEWVPSFENLFKRENGRWSDFYDAVRRLSGLPKAERQEVLERMRKESQGG